MTGLVFRLKIYPRLFGLRLGAFVGFLLGLIAILDFIGWDFTRFQAWWTASYPQLNQIQEAIQDLWTRLPHGVCLLVGFLGISGMIILSAWILGSKELWFKIATRRLTDRVKNRATQDNLEASEMNDLLRHGRGKQQAYNFLVELWENMIQDHKALSMLKIQGVSQVLPIVQVHLDLLEQVDLTRVLKVDMRSRYQNFGQVAQNAADYVGGTPEALILRKPWTRYLSRFRGPTQKDTTFRDDYVGHNVSLREMYFQAGSLALPIDCTLELYGNIMDSSDCLIDELYLHFAYDAYTRGGLAQDILRHLAWRRQVHAGKANPVDILTRVYGRAAGIGVAALTVFNMDGKYQAVRGLRSSKVGTLQEVYHVIPSGMTNVNIEDEHANQVLLEGGYFNIRMQVEKEFLEEIFSQEWAQESDSNIEPLPNLVEKYATRHLYGDHGEYRATIYLTGVVFDLLNYRPEICCLILIRDRKWWDDHRSLSPDPHEMEWKLNFEWEEKKVKLLDISDDQQIRKAMPPNQSVLSGLASFYLGVEKAKKILKDEGLV